MNLLESSEPRIQMAEIRLDRCPLDIEEIEYLFSSSDTPLVATCRVADDGDGTWEEAERKLTAAVEAGAAFLDLEIEAPKEVGKRLRRACTEYGTVMIRSSHFFAGTPSDEVLRSTFEKCRKFGGEIVKIVAMAKSEEDAARVLRLYGSVSVVRPVAESHHTVTVVRSVAELAEAHQPVEVTHSTDTPRPVTEPVVRQGSPTIEVTATKPTIPASVVRPVAVLADAPADAHKHPADLIAFAMGEAGKASRLECLKLGSPFTYAALSEEEAAAPGQWPYAEMLNSVYGTRRPLHCDSALNMPSSKSFAQRAIIAAALADGESRLSGYSPCGDNEAAIEVAKALGAEVRVETLPSETGASTGSATKESLSCAEHHPATDTIPVTELVEVTHSTDTPRPVTEPVVRSVAELVEAHQPVEVTANTGSTLIIKGIGSSSAAKFPDKLTVGESGLLTRLMIPLAATLGDGRQIEITGTGTLPDRPLKGAAEIMAGFGTVLRPLNPAPEVHVPLTVQGPLLSGKASISGKGGSQLISGLLMALPLLSGDSTLHIHDPKSIPYMFITADVMRRFGVRIGSEMEGGEDFLETQDWSLCTGVTFKIKGGQRYSAADFDIEGDWSAAANFLVAGALFGDVKLAGLDTTSLQADISIMDILMEAGASLSQINDDPQPDETSEEQSETKSSRGVITAQKAPLRAFDTDLNNCPDLFPIVSILAAFCHGRSNIQGFKRLASKESDRGTAILNMLTQMGVEASASGDTLSIVGESVESRLLNGHLLKGGDYTSSRDHRMAMALTVASWCADSPIRIDDLDCIAKSFPAFLPTYRRLHP